MPEYDVAIYTKSEELPQLLEANFFHSKTLFLITEQVPSDSLVMAVASKEGEITGQTFLTLQHHKPPFSPLIYIHAHAHEEGIYRKETNKNILLPYGISYNMHTYGYEHIHFMDIGLP